MNGRILWANLHLLFWLSLTPFVTGWMGENQFAPGPVALYGTVLWFAAVRSSRLGRRGGQTALGGATVIIRGDSVPAFDFDGLSICDYTAGLDSSSSFAVITVSPGVSHAESWSRRSDKYYWVVSGTIEFTEADVVHDLGPGDFCLVPRGTRFSYRNSSVETATLCLFHTPGFDLDSEVFEL